MGTMTTAHPIHIHHTTQNPQHLALAQAAPRFALAEPYVLTAYLQDHAGSLGFLDLRQRADGHDAAAVIDVAAEGAAAGGGAAARLRTAGAGSVPAGATVAVVTAQHFPPPDPSVAVAVAEPRRVVVAPATPGASSFAVAVVGDGKGGEEDGGLWPLRAVCTGVGRAANVRAERVAEGEEEGQVVYRLVALCEMVDGAALVLA